MANESRQVLRLFLASAGDVNPERKIVREVVDSWNRSIGMGRGWQVDVIGWDTHSSPDYGSDAQSIVNRQIADMRRYTFFVGILKHRFGTPTPRALSGTNEEFNRAVNAYKRSGRLRIALYFSAADLPSPTKAALEQKRKVLEFEEKVRPLSLHWRYRTQKEFHKRFSEHFHGWMEEQMKAAAKASRQRPTTKSTKQAPKPKAEPLAKKPANATPSKAAPPTKPKAPTKPVAPTKTLAKAKAKANSPATVSSSGTWLLLDGHVFRRRSVKGTGNQLVLEIMPHGGEDESVLRRLCESQRYQNFLYAHARDSGYVRLDKCSHESVGRATIWTLLTSFQRSSQGGWLSRDDAERRAQLLLLGSASETKPSSQQPHVSSWSGIGITNHARIKEPILFAELWRGWHEIAIISCMRPSYTPFSV